MDSFPLVEFFFNLMGILLSLFAIYYWVLLYKRIRLRKNEFMGWIWLFTSALAILLLNISSTYLLFAKAQIIIGEKEVSSPISFGTIQVVEVLSRTIIVFAMTIGVYIMYSPLKKGFIYGLEPVSMRPSEEGIKYKINTHMSYIVPEVKTRSSSSQIGNRSSAAGMRVFHDLISHQVFGLMITREHPVNVRDTWKIGNLPIIWLTNSKDAPKEGMQNVKYMDPVDLVGLSFAIKDFVQKSAESVVFIDGIEYLITQNSFNEVMRFIESLNDFISQSNTRLVISLDYKALSERELHLLRRELSELVVA